MPLHEKEWEKIKLEKDMLRQMVDDIAANQPTAWTYAYTVPSYANYTLRLCPHTYIENEADCNLCKPPIEEE